MSVSRVHNLCAISIFPDSLEAAVILDGVLRQTVEQGLEVRRQATSGYVYPRFVSIVSGAPTVRFGTRKLVQALDTIGPTGLAITSATDPGVKIFAYAHDDGGTRKTGSTHRQYLVKKGLIIPRTLMVEGQGDAEIDYEILAIKDGSNDPIAESDSVAAPTFSGDDEVFGIGPVSVGGVSIPQLRRVEIDFGVNATARTADGDVFPTFSSIDSIAPIIRLRGIDVEWLKSSNIPRAGKAAAHADTSIFLRKRDHEGQYVANATSEHIEITTAGLAVIQTMFDAEGDGEGECTLEIHSYHDGTNNPLVIDTTAAIS